MNILIMGHTQSERQTWRRDTQGENKFPPNEEVRRKKIPCDKQKKKMTKIKTHGGNARHDD